MARLRRMGAAALLAALAGCATISGSNQQVLMVHTIEDNREIVGVGCVLTNNAGRWFVTAPGRVTVQKSAGNLYIDCKKGVASVGQDIFVSKANSSATIGNAVLTAGLGYLLDKRTGAGFDYPDTLTVLMRRTGRGTAQEQEAPPSNVVY